MRHPRVRKTDLWMLILAILVLGHGILLYHFASRFTWSVVLGLILLLLLKHVGLFSSIYAVFKRRSQRPT